MTKRKYSKEIGNIKKYSMEKKIVFTNGCFDILHIGHIELLEYAKNLGDILIVGINSDDSIKKIKGSKRPITPAIDRKIILSSIKFVDFVVIFDEETPINLITEIRPDCLVKGSDYLINDIIGAEFVMSYGGVIKLYKRSNNSSTTNIIKKIQEAYLNDE